MAYDYIKRAYGRDYRPGQIVTLDELGGIDGMVKRVVGDPQYVKVEFTRDGKTKRGSFHPTSITPKNVERTRPMTKQEIAKIRHQRLRDDEQGITHPHARTVDDLLAHIGMLERLLAESKSYAAGLTTSDK